MDIIKIRTFCSLKDTIGKISSYSYRLGDIFTMHKTDKGLLSNSYSSIIKDKQLNSKYEQKKKKVE